MKKKPGGGQGKSFKNQIITKEKINVVSWNKT